jgi:hypothetical protein
MLPLPFERPVTDIVTNAEGQLSNCWPLPLYVGMGHQRLSSPPFGMNVL